jgi:tetratricopeptide (TPR) repeat protein
VDPINLRVLEGLVRVCTALGKSDDVAALQSKINSLQGVSAMSGEVPSQSQEDSFGDQVSFGGQASDETDFGEVSFADIDTDSSPLDNNYDSNANIAPSVFGESEDDVDIEVEFDADDDDFDIPLDTANTHGDDWLDVAGEIIDAIATKPRGVKFASGHDGADAQSHYDLGVAFREMGLYDEAINEFRQASSDGGRRLECLILQGACLREKGDLTNAEKVLKSLMKPGLGLEDTCSVKYELALTYGACGKNDQLVELLTEIDKTNSGYRDVRVRLLAASKDKNTLDFSDDELLKFDLN